MRLTALALAAALALPAFAQHAEERSFEADGESLRYTLRIPPTDAHRHDAAVPRSPASALDTARLLNEHLANGRIEDAALLSNAPKRRYAVLREYEQEVGPEEFRRVFAQYAYPENRVAAEISIGEHTLLIWHLAQPDRHAGLFFRRIEGRALMDDVPGETRTRLRRLLEAWRNGEIRAPPG